MSVAITLNRTVPHKYRLRPLGTPKGITYHCTATPEGKPFTAEQIIAMDVALYKQPSYHFVIELDGKVVQCLKLTELGAHVGKHNTGNIGVSYVGGVDVPGKKGKGKDTRTWAQKQAMRKLDKELRALFPSITWRKGHRDWSPDLDGDGKIEPHEWLKLCPCFDVATQF